MFPSYHTHPAHEAFLYILTLIILLSAPAVLSDPPEIIRERSLTTGFDCRFWGVDSTDDGGAICVGESASGDEEITSILLAKYTSQGLIQWQTVTGPLGSCLQQARMSLTYRADI